MNYQALSHILFSSQGSREVRCYGLTKFPDTGEFMLILEYMENGDLGTFLKREDNLSTWEEKISLLKRIFYQLSQIHSNKMLHKDFHPGNILSNSKG